ncbi:hypothetical protein ASG31_05325 [Chryseobacterium sp. Leaf404]|uniref:serine hydrolase domain-containing protein n=1 Tax=unclassified Chryseobacterium TaxID=2593645 RepID=UPI0006FB3892|nr:MULTISPECIES: serine hydrolase [unclassified Chryseobacterium]KQT18155.1 hypothetical protein ASG31_05325 [Chryseobacterium sp. Leaf404]
MKKFWTAFLVGSSVSAAIYISGFGYIFKAIGKNLKKGPITPSTDDEEKFPSHIIQNYHCDLWDKDAEYNQKTLPENILQELKKTRTSSLVIIRDHQLIFEQYWKNHSQDSLLNSFSMAKGILSMITGFAIEDGKLDSEDQLISTIFPQYADSDFGKFLTVKHLMMMQAGFDWEEEYRHPFAENSKQYFIDDLASQTLNVDLKEMPGTRYEYQSVAAQLLGLVLRKVIGCDLSSYLSEKLWKPLGMEYPAKWSTDENNTEKAFCCIHATARDFAKIGQLVMDEGFWKEKQILSKEFCRKLISPSAQNPAFAYNVWANRDHTVPHYFFYGFLGQFIIMIPEKKLIIVKTGLYNRLEVDKNKRPQQVKFLVDELSTLFQKTFPLQFLIFFVFTNRFFAY